MTSAWGSYRCRSHKPRVPQRTMRVTSHPFRAPSLTASDSKVRDQRKSCHPLNAQGTGTQSSRLHEGPLPVSLSGTRQIRRPWSVHVRPVGLLMAATIWLWSLPNGGPVLQAAAHVAPRQGLLPAGSGERSQVTSHMMSLKGLDWTARYLPKNVQFFLYIKPAKVLTSPVFRQATAPVSLSLQIALAGLQPTLGVHPLQLDEFIAAFGCEDPARFAQTMTPVILLKATQPFPPGAFSELFEARTYRGVRYRVRTKVVPGQSPRARAVNERLRQVPEQRRQSVWLVQPKLAVVAPQAWIKRLIENRAVDEPLETTLAQVLSGLEFDAARDDYAVGACVRVLQGTNVLIPPQMRAAGAPALQPAAESDAQSPLELLTSGAGIHAFALGGRTQTQLYVRAAFLCVDEDRAQALEQRLQSLKSVVIGAIRQRFGAQATIPSDETVSEQEPNSSVASDPETAGLRDAWLSLGQSLERMRIERHGAVLRTQVDFTGRALAALVLDALRARSEQPPPDDSSNGPPGHSPEAEGSGATSP